jgi:hypothetical protein
MSDGKVHSKLGASSYDRWGACPGSIAASEGIESVSSIYAEEGTRAHDIAANLLIGNGPKEPISDEMAEAIFVYLEHVAVLRAKRPSFEAIEQKLDLSSYHPQLFGTADYVCYYAATKTLHVVDYKHGKGIPVSVKRSKQLMYYGMGALVMNKFPIEKIVLTIVQPRCYHPDGAVRSWETDPVDMLDFAAQLVDDALATEKPDAPLVAGDHCRFCPAQPTCPKPREQAMILATAGFENLAPALAPEKLALYLEKIPQIKAWCEAVHSYAHQQAELGNVPPGWKLVDKRATRKWIDGFVPPDNWDVFGLGDETFYEKKLKSPAQMEKFFPSQKKEIEKFVIKESSGKTLVQVKDDRAPVKGAIETMFTTET